MAPNIAELIAALPEDTLDDVPQISDDRLHAIFEQLSTRPVPVGSFQRLWAIGGLQAKLTFAYLAYYVRTWFHSSDNKEQQLIETNLRAAFKTLQTMGYLRGAVMKVGQILAASPEILPDQFAELLEKLHFEAPPMHYSLLREHVENELGDDPGEIFDDFETESFAAASLGQVHRARLRSGESVAVKIQYPGIARTIRTDIANLRRLLFPLRISKDWDSLNAQFGEAQAVLESETDYEQESASLKEARAAFREDDGIVVPRVYDQYSTRRILTMELVDGDDYKKFLASNPSQEVRNRFGELILRTGMRLYFSHRLLYSDFHPGNFLFREDGRLGFIDFGGLRRFNDEEWALMARDGYFAMTTSNRQDLLDYIQRSLMFSDQEMEARPDVVGVVEEWANYYWQPLRFDGRFDYGDPDYFRLGASLWKKAAKLRVLRQRPVNIFAHRCNFELCALLYRLRAQVECRRIYEEEIEALGWLV